MIMPSLITLPNGPKMRPTFSNNEMNSRLNKLREQMAAQDLEAVVFTSIHNIKQHRIRQGGLKLGLVLDGNMVELQTNLSRFHRHHFADRAEKVVSLPVGVDQVVTDTAAVALATVDVGGNQG